MLSAAGGHCHFLRMGADPVLSPRSPALPSLPGQGLLPFPTSDGWELLSPGRLQTQAGRLLLHLAEPLLCFVGVMLCVWGRSFRDFWPIAL